MKTMLDVLSRHIAEDTVVCPAVTYSARNFSSSTAQCGHAIRCFIGPLRIAASAEPSGAETHGISFLDPLHSSQSHQCANRRKACRLVA